MTQLLRDSKGPVLVKYVSSCMYERGHSAWKSCAQMQGIRILECTGLGVCFFKYSNEPQIKQNFYCIWYSADNKKQVSWIPRQRGMGKRGDTARCPSCSLAQGVTGSSSPHLLATAWGLPVWRIQSWMPQSSACEWKQQDWTWEILTTDPSL